MKKKKEDICATSRHTLTRYSIYVTLAIVAVLASTIAIFLFFKPCCFGKVDISIQMDNALSSQQTLAKNNIIVHNHCKGSTNTVIVEECETEEKSITLNYAGLEEFIQTQISLVNNYISIVAIVVSLVGIFATIIAIGMGISLSLKERGLNAELEEMQCEMDKTKAQIKRDSDIGVKKLQDRFNIYILATTKGELIPWPDYTNSVLNWGLDNGPEIHKLITQQIDPLESSFKEIIKDWFIQSDKYNKVFYKLKEFIRNKHKSIINQFKSYEKTELLQSTLHANLLTMLTEFITWSADENFDYWQVIKSLLRLIEDSIHANHKIVTPAFLYFSNWYLQVYPSLKERNIQERFMVNIAIQAVLNTLSLKNSDNNFVDNNQLNTILAVVKEEFERITQAEQSQKTT